MTTPYRHGQPWDDTEVHQLLQGIKRKDSISKIASDHQRTPGSIRGRLKQIAADYYFNDNRPMDEIMKFTGLDAETISDAISKRQYEIDMKEKKQKTIPQMMAPEPKKEGMVLLLTEIRDMMKEMMELMKKNTSN
jgi:adenine specific DNA methylase Mod